MVSPASSSCRTHTRGLAATVAVLGLAATLGVGCRGAGPQTESRDGASGRDVESAAPAPAADPQPARPRIVALGDSLTAGYGLESAESYPAQLQRRLDEAGLAYEVVNMGVSGDTSAGGLRRLDWALDGDVRVLIVALGGNDGLRGLAPEDLERNLNAIVDRAQARNMRVLLCGMEAPPNLGQPYTQAFRDVYPRVAEQQGVALLPFLLDGVAGVPSLNQPDGIHPTAEGARRVADLVWARLKPLLEEPASR